jgi:hypothetical protein
LSLNFGLAPGYQSADVITAISAALGVIPPGGTAPAGGLFSVDQRQLGGPEYASRIEGIVQNVEGVAWVEVTAFGPLPSADDPSKLTAPWRPRRLDLVPCATDQVLALYGAQFKPAATTASQGVSV